MKGMGVRGSEGGKERGRWGEGRRDKRGGEREGEIRDVGRREHCEKGKRAGRREIRQQSRHKGRSKQGGMEGKGREGESEIEGIVRE